MSDSNPTRPTEPSDPGRTKPTEPIQPGEQAKPAEPVRPTTAAFDAGDTSSWFASEPSSSSGGYTAATAVETKRLPARFGTIFWGVLLLAFAGFMVANAVVPFVQDPIVWLIAGLIAAGAVLVIAGIAAAVRRTE